MATIYLDERDYRLDMRDKHSPARMHAMIRRVAALHDQSSPTYAALYWVGCQAHSDLRALQSGIQYRSDYRSSFERECNSKSSYDKRYTGLSPEVREKLWQ
jgi:hypothetical protein